MDFEKGENVLEEFIEDMNELINYKKKYESAMNDKQTMSDELYKLMTKEYENTSYEDRCKQYIEHECSCCRYRIYGCDYQDNLPKDILQPIPSNKAWIPARKSCGHFEWS